MREWGPRQLEKLGFKHRPDYLQDREAVQGMTRDQEVNQQDHMGRSNVRPITPE